MTPFLRWLPPLAVAGALTFGFWAWIGRGIELPPAPSPKLACVSYTPFQGDQTPYDPSLVIPPEQIAADLDYLKPVTDCVRIYATDQGIDATVPLAAERGSSSLKPGKLAAMQYFFAYELPKIDAWLGVVARREAVCRTMQPDWF